MKKISLNNNWICKRAGQPEQGMTVNIPHDAMQMDEKDELSAGGVHNGWYVCHDYIYEKAFCASEDWREKRVILEFEGIYKMQLCFSTVRGLLYMSMDIPDFISIFLKDFVMRKTIV